MANSKFNCSCGKIETRPFEFTFICDNCNFKRYCSFKCQRENFSIHTKYCNNEYTRKIIFYINYLKRFTNKGENRINKIWGYAHELYTEQGNSYEYQSVICDLNIKSNSCRLRIGNKEELIKIMGEFKDYIEIFKDKLLIVFVENNNYLTISGYPKVTSFNRSGNVNSTVVLVF